MQVKHAGSHTRTIIDRQYLDAVTDVNNDAGGGAVGVEGQKRLLHHAHTLHTQTLHQRVHQACPQWVTQGLRCAQHNLHSHTHSFRIFN